MEGLLYIPPDRSTLIGRAIWKPRYVLLGVDTPESNQFLEPPVSSSKKVVTALRSSRSSVWNLSACAEQPDRPTLCLFVYKQKGDRDPVARYPIENITDCKVQDVAQRRPGPYLPTLVLTVDTSDSQKSAWRSGQSHVSSKSKPEVLWFRSVPEQLNNIHTWCTEILSQISFLQEQRVSIERAVIKDHPPMALQTLAVDVVVREERPSTSQNSLRPSSSRPSLRSRGSSKFNLFSSMGRTSTNDRSSPPTTSGSGAAKSDDRPSLRSREPSRSREVQFPTVTEEKVLPRRETILDRAFAKQLGDQPIPSPVESDSAISRFDQMMSSIDATEQPQVSKLQHKNAAAAIAAFDDTPNGLSHTTKRALEFILTGSRSSSKAEQVRSRSRPTSVILSDNASSRRNSIHSILDIASGTATVNKRLSLGDFARRLSSSSLLQGNTLSRNSSLTDSVSSSCLRELDRSETQLSSGSRARPISFAREFIF